MEKKDLDRKWFNYFSNMRNKYNMRASGKKPIILFLDAKDSSKNRRELLKGEENGFFDALDKTAKYFSSKYNCIAIWGTDEISFIIEDTYNFIETINNENNFKTHDIVSIFSQYFFEYFNNIYSKEVVYWHCKCFNIAKEKVESYLRFKSKGILKGVTAAFLKKNGIKKANEIKLEEKLKMCENYETYYLIKDYQKGVLYLNGNKIDIDEYLNGKIVVIKENDNEKNNEFFNLMDFDNSI